MLTPPYFLLLAIVASILLHFYFPIVKMIPLKYNYIGIPIMIASYALIGHVDYLFKQKQTTIDSFGKASILITDGVFKISRNPIYLGMALLLFGLCVLLRSASTLIPLALFIIIINVIIIPKEEKSLKDTFGDSYILYLKKVRRWI